MRKNVTEHKFQLRPALNSWGATMKSEVDDVWVDRWVFLETSVKKTALCETQSRG